jgi:hypothetical protein
LQAGGRRFDPGWLHPGSPCKSTHFAGSGRGAGRVVFLDCVPCVPHVREARAMRVGSLSDGPNARMGYAKLTTTERYLHSEPTAYRRRAARPAFSPARLRSRRALALPPALRREKGRRSPDASGSRSATARGVSVASHGTRKRRRRYCLSADGGVAREPIARCRTPGPRPKQASRATGPRRSLVEEGERFGAAVGRLRCLSLACRSDGRPPRGLTAGRP